MSVDNGIYILKTPSSTSLGKELKLIEYRVIHAQAIDNIYYKGSPINALELIRYFGRAKVMGHLDVTKEVEKLEKEISYLEYGVEEIPLDKPFDEYMVEASRELVAMKLYEFDYPMFADSTEYDESHWRKETPGKKDTYYGKADEIISVYIDPTQD